MLRMTSRKRERKKARVVLSVSNQIESERSSTSPFHHKFLSSIYSLACLCCQKRQEINKMWIEIELVCLIRSMITISNQWKPTLYQMLLLYVNY